MSSLTFSGHETFHCRPFWLKKGFDFISSEAKFSDQDAVVKLGVGKNMVMSIRYWMRAFDILDESDELTEFSSWMLSDNGFDPYLEDEGSLWLLHYHLNRRNRASIFQIIFSELRDKRPEFNADVFADFVIDRLDEKANRSTLTTDYHVFHRTYVNKREATDLEDSFTGLLTDLALVSKVEREQTEYQNDKKKVKKTVRDIVQSKGRPALPPEVLLYCILVDEPEGKSISFKSLMEPIGSVGRVFALNPEGMVEKLEELTQLPYRMVFSNEAGVRELQFKGKKPTPQDVLKNYYGK